MVFFCFSRKTDFTVEFQGGDCAPSLGWGGRADGGGRADDSI